MFRIWSSSSEFDIRLEHDIKNVNLGWYSRYIYWNYQNLPEEKIYLFYLKLKSDIIWYWNATQFYHCWTEFNRGPERITKLKHNTQTTKLTPTINWPPRELHRWFRLDPGFWSYCANKSYYFIFPWGTLSLHVHICPIPWKDCVEWHWVPSLFTRSSDCLGQIWTAHVNRWEGEARKYMIMWVRVLWNAGKGQQLPTTMKMIINYRN